MVRACVCVYIYIMSEVKMLKARCVCPGMLKTCLHVVVIYDMGCYYMEFYK